jgi:hypothetical protein
MQKLTLSLLSCFVFFILNAQQRIPRHYVTLFGGAEWNTLSVTAGAEYEHTIAFNEKNMLSAKCFAVLPYELGNFSLLASSSYNGKAYRFGALANGNFYLGKKQNAQGFYFTLGAGPGIASIEEKNSETNSRFYDTRLKLAAETGVGIQFNLGKGAAMRLGITTRWGVFEGGYTAGQITIGL